jgi:hypothetical protein
MTKQGNDNTSRSAIEVRLIGETDLSSSIKVAQSIVKAAAKPTSYGVVEELLDERHAGGGT